ncbi:hypothetical protein [Xanthomonas dyei]|uniref:hypothetical protein n=1 Tax=Xanthomonas dyei TaxID=743699 RepID=UPI001E4C05DB|nr:hypothetical protein [Xanthomonas dyei]MCC4634121.1 hypothetical protein [Xanthomonas dyei pv. eucalypti]
MQAGNTLLIPSGKDGNHLFFCVLGPKILAGKNCVLLVPLCTVRAGHDPSCYVGPGDHPFLRHDSFIDYRYLRVDLVEEIEKKLGSTYFGVSENASQQLLDRIQAGLKVSKRVKGFIKDDWF